jgi:hypothetical protein
MRTNLNSLHELSVDYLRRCKFQELMRQRCDVGRQSSTRRAPAIFVVTMELARARFAHRSPRQAPKLGGRRAAPVHKVCMYMSNVNGYDEFCKELASLAATRLLGRTIDRSTIALAFHEALSEIRRADTPTTECDEGQPMQDGPDPAPVEMPSEIANILGWHSGHADMTIKRCEREAHRVVTEQQLFGAS